MTHVQNPIIMKKFNKGIARMVTSVDLGDLNKDIKFICNTFIYDWIVVL